VTITKRGENQVEEFRIGGQLYMMKITPPHGVPYYLIDEKGDGHFTRQDNLDPGARRGPTSQIPVYVRIHHSFPG
jgi:hypothetical protein